jgi:hypothetical protein
MTQQIYWLGHKYIKAYVPLHGPLFGQMYTIVLCTWAHAQVSAWDHVDGGGYAGGQPSGAGGGTGVAARIQRDPDPVLVGKHGANIEFLQTYSIGFVDKEQSLPIDPDIR